MSNDDNQQVSGKGEIVLYQTPDGATRVECRFEQESIWLSQALMAELYQTSKQNISLHLENLFEEGELDKDQVVKDYLTTGPDSKQYTVKHYNLDAILAVGYRVRSKRGTQFRKWATAKLREFLVKGFVMDDERLKNLPSPERGIPDYFDELLERIRDIRARERRMYLRVREIFALAGDYEPSSSETTRASGRGFVGSLRTFASTSDPILTSDLRGEAQERPRPTLRCIAVFLGPAGLEPATNGL